MHSHRRPVEREFQLRDLRLPDGRELRYVTTDHCDDLDFAIWKSTGGLKVIASLDPTPHGTLMHLCVSLEEGSPTWADLRAVRTVFYSTDAEVLLILPRDDDYGDAHPACFHLWETPKEWGIR